MTADGIIHTFNSGIALIQVSNNVTFNRAIQRRITFGKLISKDSVASHLIQGRLHRTAFDT